MKETPYCRLDTDVVLPNGEPSPSSPKPPKHPSARLHYLQAFEHEESRIKHMRPLVLEPQGRRLLTLEDSLDNYKAFGHGTFFYFFSLKYLGILFAVLSAICLIPLIANCVGGGLSDFPSLPFWLRTTVINCPLLFSQSSQPFMVVNTSLIHAGNFTAIDFNYRPLLLPQSELPGFSLKFQEFAKSTSFNRNNGYSFSGGSNCRDGLSTISGDSRCSRSALNQAILANCSVAESSVVSSNITDSSVSSSSFVNASVSAQSLIAGSSCGQSSFFLANLTNCYANFTIFEESSARDSDLRESTISFSIFEKSQVFASRVDNSEVRGSLVYAVSAYDSNVTESTADSSFLGSVVLTQSEASNCNLQGVEANSTKFFSSKAIDSALGQSTVVASQLRKSSVRDSYVRSSTIAYANLNLNSNVFNSRVEISNLNQTRVQFSSLSNCVLVNCIILNSTLYNNELTDEVIFNNKRVRRQGESVPQTLRRILADSDALSLKIQLESDEAQRLLQQNSLQDVAWWLNFFQTLLEKIQVADSMNASANTTSTSDASNAQSTPSTSSTEVTTAPSASTTSAPAVTDSATTASNSTTEANNQGGTTGSTTNTANNTSDSQTSATNSANAQNNTTDNSTSATNPANTSNNTTNPATTSDNTTNPTTTSDNTTNPTTTSSNTTNSATTSDNTTNPATTSDNTANSATTSDNTTNPGTTSDNTTNSATTSDNTTNSATISDNTTNSATTSDNTTNPAISSDSSQTNATNVTDTQSNLSDTTNAPTSSQTNSTDNSTVSESSQTNITDNSTDATNSGNDQTSAGDNSTNATNISDSSQTNTADNSTDIQTSNQTGAVDNSTKADASNQTIIADNSTIGADTQTNTTDNSAGNQTTTENPATTDTSNQTNTTDTSTNTTDSSAENQTNASDNSITSETSNQTDTTENLAANQTSGTENSTSDQTTGQTNSTDNSTNTPTNDQTNTTDNSTLAVDNSSTSQTNTSDNSNTNPSTPVSSETSTTNSTDTSNTLQTNETTAPNDSLTNQTSASDNSTANETPTETTSSDNSALNETAIVDNWNITNINLTDDTLFMDDPQQEISSITDFSSNSTSTSSSDTSQDSTNSSTILQTTSSNTQSTQSSSTSSNSNNSPPSQPPPSSSSQNTQSSTPSDNSASFSSSTTQESSSPTVSQSASSDSQSSNATDTSSPPTSTSTNDNQSSNSTQEDSAPKSPASSGLTPTLSSVVLAAQPGNTNIPDIPLPAKSSSEQNYNYNPATLPNFAFNVRVPVLSDFPDSDGSELDSSTSVSAFSNGQLPNSATVFDLESITVESSAIQAASSEDPFEGVVLYYDGEELLDTLNEYALKVENYANDIDFKNNKAYFYISLVCDIVICCIFFFAVIAFRFIMTKKFAEVERETPSISKFSVMIADLPPSVTSGKIERFISGLTDAKPVRIDFVYELHTFLKPIVKRMKIEKKLLELEEKPLLTEYEKWQKSVKYQEKIEHTNKKLGKELGRTEVDITNLDKEFKKVYAYVVFENSIIPYDVKANFEQARIQGNSSLTTIDDGPVQLFSASDVYDINFFHIGLKKRTKLLKILLFIFAIFLLIVANMYICMILEAAIESGVSRVNCPDNAAPSKPKLTARYEIKYCYCNANVDKILDQDYRRTCGPFLYTDKSAFYSPFIIVVVITTFNFLIGWMVEKMFEWLKFERYSKETSIKIVVQFLFEYINILGGLLITTNVDSSILQQGKFPAIEISIKLVSPDFYVKTGSKVIMLNFFGMFLPYVLNIIRAFVKLKYAKYRQNKESSQHKSKHQAKPEEFGLDEQSVSILTTIATSLTFSSIMPVLVLFAFFSLVIAFYTNRFLLVKLSHRPHFFTDDLINNFFRLLPLMLICHLIFSVSVFGDWTIFLDAKGKAFWVNFLQTNEVPALSSDLQYRTVKNIALVVICGLLFSILIIFEAFLKLFYYRRLVDKAVRELGPAQEYKEYKEQLLFNSALGYDFLLLPKFAGLVEIPDEELMKRSSFEFLNKIWQEKGLFKFVDRKFESNREKFGSFENQAICLRKSLLKGLKGNSETMAFKESGTKLNSNKHKEFRGSVAEDQPEDESQIDSVSNSVNESNVELLVADDCKEAEENKNVNEHAGEKNQRKAENAIDVSEKKENKLSQFESDNLEAPKKSGEKSEVKELKEENQKELESLKEVKEASNVEVDQIASQNFLTPESKDSNGSTDRKTAETVDESKESFMTSN